MCVCLRLIFFQLNTGTSVSKLNFNHARTLIHTGSWFLISFMLCTTI